MPGIYVQLGDAYSRLLQWESAKTAYKKAISLDEDNALALQGLSTVYRRQGLNQETVDTALRAVSLLHRLPLAHFNIGVAMARSGESDRAILAFETALRFQPDMVNAHRYLATLHRNNGGDLEKAAFHQWEAQKIMRSHPRAKKGTTDRSEKLFDLPEIPKREERLKILFKERPDPKRDEEKSGKTFVLVSGLPRSGTSLMMQMLEAGGLSVMTDRERSADVDNPRGYYEWEAIKQIGHKPEMLDDKAVNGKAIKCISMLLPRMPPKHEYKVVFMTRPIDEVIASQRDMTKRLGTKGAELDPEQLMRGLQSHSDEVQKWLKAAPYMKMIEIDYPTLVQEPLPQIARLVEFLGTDRLPALKEMTKVVDPSLHRKKSV
jgi:hypothetical protein